MLESRGEAVSASRTDGQAGGGGVEGFWGGFRMGFWGFKFREDLIGAQEFQGTQTASLRSKTRFV